MTLALLITAVTGAWAQETSWTNIVSNSDMEGTDVSCFYVKENAKGAENMYIARITEGIGVENSRAIKVLSDGKEVETWDTQFFIRLPYELPAGTKYKLSFDYKADKDASADFQCANEPGEYIIWYIGENDRDDFNFTDSWQSFSREYTVPSACNGQKHSDGDWLDNFQTIYFSLAMKAKYPDAEDKDNVFIIDNVKVEIPTEVLNNLTPKPVTDPSLMLTYVTKDAANQWSFDMPGYDMEITPEYAPTAKFATESDVELLPTAAEGVIAGTSDPIIVEGTVATGQGTAMYFATTNKELTAEQAAQANGWLSTLPTAVGYDDATTVYVWYYIAGADTPDGQEATDKNTFNDSEICAQPLEVSVLSNKFDIAFKAANANTIESGKATVTVKTGDAEAVDKTADIDAEHKLKAVKMGSEVKVKANTGYKFRKVEVKKGGAAAAKTITIGDMELTYADGDTWETIVSKNSDKIKTLAGGYIVQVAQPEPNKYRYLKVVLSTNKVNPSDIIDPSKNYEWGTIEVYS